ncbi:MAG: GNAT family N-acetyltransferase [Anaerolineales bacterium]|nr:GNAT family N-acetyltransferase [Anaerolineales bacterium]
MSSITPNQFDFEILPASWRDLNALRQLEKACFPLDAWPLLDLVAVLSFSNVVRLKAEIGDEMVGFVAADIKPAENLAWIATIGVLPAYRRQGIAAALLQACEARLEVGIIRLSVRRHNQTAIRLYQNLGYSQVGVWPAYYQDGTDALVFEKAIV